VFEVNGATVRNGKRLAQLLCQTGLIDQARVHLEGLLEQNPYDGEALVALADIEYQSERWDNASALLRRLVVVMEGEGNLVAGCTFRNLGGRGVIVNGARSGVQSCHLYQLGQGGITLAGGDRRTLIPGEILGNSAGSLRVIW
jgi:tetratricopeptide (TPR) repeat protein